MDISPFLLGWLIGIIQTCWFARHVFLENAGLRNLAAVLKRSVKRPRFRKKDRILWKILFHVWSRWRSACLFLSPDTVLRWSRKRFLAYWLEISTPVGRPEIPWEMIKDIRRLARKSPELGAEKIAEELAHVHPEISPNTVRKYWMRKEPADPRRRQGWLTFFKNHADAIVCTDFFTVPAWKFPGFPRDQMYYVFFFIHVATRRILHINVTMHPSQQWVLQQFRELMHPGQLPLKYCVMDNDGIFQGIDEKVKSIGLKTVRIQPRTPQQNPYAERWVRTAREGCTDLIIPARERHLLSRLQEFVDYYNRFRPHSGINGRSPLERKRKIKPSKNAELLFIEHCGGLHRHLEWLHTA